jgi:hypothetical protein
MMADRGIERRYGEADEEEEEEVDEQVCDKVLGGALNFLR